MIALQTGAPVRIPALLDEAAPGWLVRAGTVIERAELEAELAARDAGQVHFFELEAEILAAARQLLPEDAQGRIAEIVTQLRGGDIQGEADRQLWAGVEEQLLTAWPAYARLVRRAARREQYIPVLAARRFLVGREGAEPLPRGADGLVTEAALATIDPWELRHVGLRAYGLLYMGPGDKDFLSPPSSAGAAPATSKRRRAATAAAAG